MRNRIRKLREMRGLRQADVSAATGIDQKTLSNYETGKTNPDSYALVKLADFFDVSIDFLLYRTDSNITDNSGAVKLTDELIDKLNALKNYFKN